MIKNIIFDFDGVLVDSEILAAKAFSEYFNKHNISFSEKEFSTFAGKKTIEVIEELSKKFEILNKEDFFNDIINITNNIYETNLTAVIGAESFLEKANLNYFIGSNSVKERILTGLKKVNFDRFFSDEKVYSFDMVKKAKPEPDIYLTAIESNKLNIKETIIIEDSVIGVKAGFNAGVKVIGLTAGEHWYKERSANELKYAGASLLIDSYDKLLNELKNL
tara:strand:+ start:1343 stop:2002 length:660 start_codon:yes stop_codon:yes gene_type:complete